MTDLLFRQDAYRTSAPARVVAVTGEGGVILDTPLFYPRGGGQPGDSGRLSWTGGRVSVATAVPAEGGSVVLVPAEAAALPAPGAEVEQHLDWDRRYGHMRMHTALHLLSVALPWPVTGGAIAADKGRLDFAMEGAPTPDPKVVQGQLNALVDRDLPVSEEWIDEADLDANPGLVKTLSVAPPRGAGRIRLVRIGTAEETIDLQPCGGTHVRRTAEIGKLAVTRIENKGRMNRRVTIAFAGAATG
ncbi:alanyl-tRNA editing protein [Rhodobacterales bacterium HKCCE2091]|nr:alanyl-tRNA editing protein [Rhodobacterales bacterium HKCCE2091]